MKKLYLFIIVMVIAGMMHAQECSDLLISEYVEGWNNNKAIEIYNPTPNVIVFTDNYRLIRWSNGSTIADQDIQYVLPLVGEIQPYEVAVIIREGIHRMYEKQENIFYYLTIHNENYVMPAMPEGVEDGIIKGMYKFSSADVPAKEGCKAHLFGSAAIMTEVLRAKELLAEYEIPTDIWSATSYNELSREALDAERQNRISDSDDARKPYVQQLLENEEGVFVAASDYMKALPMSIAQWVPGNYTVLGTDGYGLSESRPDLREHFEVNAEHICYAALKALTAEGKFDAKKFKKAHAKLGINHSAPNPSISGPAQKKH